MSSHSRSRSRSSKGQEEEEEEEDDDDDDDFIKTGNTNKKQRLEEVLSHPHAPKAPLTVTAEKSCHTLMKGAHPC